MILTDAPAGFGTARRQFRWSITCFFHGFAEFGGAVQEYTAIPTGGHRRHRLSPAEAAETPAWGAATPPGAAGRRCRTLPAELTQGFLMVGGGWKAAYQNAAGAALMAPVASGVFIGGSVDVAFMVCCSGRQGFHKVVTAGTCACGSSQATRIVILMEFGEAARGFPGFTDPRMVSWRRLAVGCCGLARHPSTVSHFAGGVLSPTCGTPGDLRVPSATSNEDGTPGGAASPRPLPPAFPRGGNWKIDGGLKFPGGPADLPARGKPPPKTQGGLGPVGLRQHLTELERNREHSAR